MNSTTVDLVERLIRALVKEFNISAPELLSGVHNACVHGSIFPDHYWGKNDKLLSDMFCGFETSIEAARKASGDD